MTSIKIFGLALEEHVIIGAFVNESNGELKAGENVFGDFDEEIHLPDVCSILILAEHVVFVRPDDFIFIPKKSFEKMEVI